MEIIVIRKVMPAQCYIIIILLYAAAAFRILFARQTTACTGAIVLYVSKIIRIIYALPLRD